MKSEIQYINGMPTLFADGKAIPPLAYTAYFDECGRWSDFIKSGYRIFFVNVSFTSLPINNVTGFTPFLKGVFEADSPDYSDFDNTVKSIIAECEDALIFPRINLAMPEKWIRKHLSETVKTPNGGARESMLSDVFKRDGVKYLELLISHIRESDYASSVAGYQICGGTTQEWMHHDLFGSYSEKSAEKFRKWAAEKYGEENIRMPLREELSCSEAPEVKKYYEFSNEMNAKTVEFFARSLKEIINNEQIVGVFYGYIAFVNDVLAGLHGLRFIADSPYIDFFSSPCAYDNNRKLGTDWGDMLPVDSLKLHKKLCFIECDIRTFLTKGMQESRPGVYPDGIYTLYDENGGKTVWCGPENLPLSLSAVRKAFAHQAVKGTGIWWFDMWGGWYHNEEIMNELGRMYTVYENLRSIKKDELPSAEVIFFVDEKAYLNLPRGNHLLHSVNAIRIAMGNTGIPFDIYAVEDAPLILQRYKAAIFSAPIPSDSGIRAAEICKALDIPCVEATSEKAFYSTDELRSLLEAIGVHCYNEDGCVIYSGNGILAVHTVNDGEVKISLPRKYTVKGLFGAESEEYYTDTLTIEALRHNTVIYILQP